MSQSACLTDAQLQEWRAIERWLLLRREIRRQQRNADGIQRTLMALEG